MMKQPRLSAIFVAVSAAALILASSSSFAQKHQVVENYKAEANYKAEVAPVCLPCMLLNDGFYVGLGGGYEAYRVRVSNANLATLDTNSSRLGAQGWVGSLFAGYGRYFDQFYLAGELNANLSNAKESNSGTTAFGTSTYDQSVRVRSSYGASIIPGIKVNDSSLLYVRAGYLGASVRSSASYTNTAIPVAASGSSNRWTNGWNAGVGIETAVAPSVSVRGEYTYAQFDTKNVNAVDATGVVISSARLKPTDNQFMMSVLYHFV